MPPFKLVPITQSFPGRTVQQQPINAASIGRLLMQRQMNKIRREELAQAREEWQAGAPLRHAKAQEAQAKADIEAVRAGQINEQTAIANVLSQVAQVPEGDARVAAWQQGVQALDRMGVDIQGLEQLPPDEQTLTGQVAASRARIADLLDPIKGSAKIQEAMERVNSRLGQRFGLRELQTLHPGLLEEEMDLIDERAGDRAERGRSQFSVHTGDFAPPERGNRSAAITEGQKLDRTLDMLNDLSTGGMSPREFGLTGSLLHLGAQAVAEGSALFLNKRPPKEIDQFLAARRTRIGLATKAFSAMLYADAGKQLSDAEREFHEQAAATMNKNLPEFEAALKLGKQLALRRRLDNAILLNEDGGFDVRISQRYLDAASPRQLQIMQRMMAAQSVEEAKAAQSELDADLASGIDEARVIAQQRAAKQGIHYELKNRY